MRALATGPDPSIDNALGFGVFDSAQRDGKARRGAVAYLVSPRQRRRRGDGRRRAPPARSSRREWGRGGGARPVVAARNQGRGETAEGNEVVRDSAVQSTVAPSDDAPLSRGRRWALAGPGGPLRPVLLVPGWTFGQYFVSATKNFWPSRKLRFL
jgi:hypothetical protein